MKGTFIAVMTQTKPGRFECRVPDFPGCITSGRTLEEASEMIEDAANLWACDIDTDGREIPVSTPISAIKKGPNDILQLVKVDTEAYEKMHDTKSVRKNVSLPAWMVAKAERAGISCSKVLQEALAIKFAET